MDYIIDKPTYRTAGSDSLYNANSNFQMYENFVRYSRPDSQEYKSVQTKVPTLEGVVSI